MDADSGQESAQPEADKITPDSDSTVSAPSLAVGGPLVVVWENVEESIGWLDMRIGTKGHLMAGVIDPYPGMIDWVRRCCEEWEPQTYLWDSEGMRFLFTFLGCMPFLRVEEVPMFETEPATIWSGRATRMDIHKAFYQGFMTFVEGPEFDPWRWCGFTFREWVDRFSQGRASEFVESWLERGKARVELHMRVIQARGESWDWMEVGAIPEIDSKELDKVYMGGTLPLRDDLRLPDNWDSATRNERQGILDRILDVEFGYGGGPHPRTLRSEALDRWLQEEMSRMDESPKKENV